MLTTKAIKNFLDKKATFAGSSIHFLTLNFDFGPVLGRTFEKINAHDNIDSLYSRLKNKENKLYVEVLEKLTKQKQKILIIGSGGREHAIGWKVAQSSRAGELFFAPGNVGTAEIGINIDIKATDIEKLIAFVKKEKIDLTLALPDDPLALGIVDEFNKKGLRIWGPKKSAAQIESSKAFSKKFMKKHNLPTAKFEIFSDFEKAKEYVIKQSFPVVIKASGLALGKGVVIAQTQVEATEALQNMLVKKVFGEAGTEVVIEEFLVGPEISIHVFSDGKNYKIFPPSQDHKKIGENDIGLNTGGMGTIAPLPFVTKKLMTEIEKNIVAPTIQGMAEEGNLFSGVLYPGLILTKDGPKILEYNARFGDPETQSYMRLLDGDILDIFEACIDGNLENIDIRWKNSLPAGRQIFACTIVLAGAGYPGNYEKGKVISGIAEAEAQSDIVVFHAGTKIVDGSIVTNGGRVLGVSATGKTLEEALGKAYKAVGKIHFEGMQYRKDIGKKALLQAVI
jgi:phosphoribosylamine--glycine ligase